MDTQKFIHSVKLYILHQLKPYSRVKSNWEPSYTCISIFVELGQVREIGPKCPKSWASIHRKWSKVLNSTSHIKWSLYSNKNSIWGFIYTCLVYLGNWEKLGRFMPNSPIIDTNTQKVIHSVKLQVPHQMKPCLKCKGHLRVNLYLFCVFANWGELAKFSPNHGQRYTESHPKC